MSNQNTLPPVIVSPSQGRVLRASGEAVMVLLAAKQTGGPDMNRVVQIPVQHGIHFVQS